MKRVELLAPAGSMEALIAAVNNGADAVYLGLTAFGARAFADNFNHQSLIEAVSFCHLRNVNVYITMNTLLFENEIDKALEEVDFLYKINVDALIVQDLGLFTLVRKHYPDFEIHCSTQMHIHNKEGALFMQAKGAKRVVLARETPLEVIKEITATGIDVEIFSYGALCMSYSGQCLMSSILQGRSGNRGVCAQHCRLPYKLIDNTVNEYIDTFKYLLSPKDLNVLNDLDKLLDLQVSSIKIEGRMKRSEYVGLAVKIFRKAIDAYYNNEKFSLSDEDMEHLKLMFNRGFTGGKVFNVVDKEFMNPHRPNHMGIDLGKVVGFNQKYIDIKLDRGVNQGDGIRILSDFDDHGMILNKIYLNGKLVNKASKGDVIAVLKREKVNLNDKVVITTDVNLNRQIAFDNQKLYRKLPLNVEVIGRVNEPLTLIVSENNLSITVHSEFILQEALNNPISKETLIQQLNKTGETPFCFNYLKVDIENIFIPVKSINELRRKALNQFSLLKIDKYHRRGKREYVLEKLENVKTNCRLVEVNCFKQLETLKSLNADWFSNSNNVLKLDKEVNFLSYAVNEQSEMIASDKMIISEIGMLNIIKDKVVAGYNLNVTNSYALAFLLENNCDLVIYSLELDERKIKQIEEAFFKRFNFYPNTATMVYGRRDLMITKQKIAYEGLAKPGKINLAHAFSIENDKKQRFPLMKDDLGFTHLLENKPFEYEGRLLTSNVFYRFTIEDTEEIKRIRRKIK